MVTLQKFLPKKSTFQQFYNCANVNSASREYYLDLCQNNIDNSTARSYGSYSNSLKIYKFGTLFS